MELLKRQVSGHARRPITVMQKDCLIVVSFSLKSNTWIFACCQCDIILVIVIIAWMFLRAAAHYDVHRFHSIILLRNLSWQN